MVQSLVMLDIRRYGAGARRVALLAVSLLLAVAPPAFAGDTAGEIIDIATAGGATLKTRVVRPQGQGPFPLAVISHGSPASAAQRPTMQVPTFAPASEWLLARGYMVALPLRRGYGETGGAWAEN